jgi:hypothetical protein
MLHPLETHHPTGGSMNLHISTRYDKWKSKWYDNRRLYFDTFKSAAEVSGELLQGYGFQLNIVGHCFTLFIHWKKY